MPAVLRGDVGILHERGIEFNHPTHHQGAHLLFSLPPRHLEQTPALAIGLTPGHRLDIAPRATSTGRIGRIQALAHRAFQPVGPPRGATPRLHQQANLDLASPSGQSKTLDDKSRESVGNMVDPKTSAVQRFLKLLRYCKRPYSVIARLAS